MVWQSAGIAPLNKNLRHTSGARLHFRKPMNQGMLPVRMGRTSNRNARK